MKTKSIVLPFILIFLLSCDKSDMEDEITPSDYDGDGYSDDTDCDDRDASVYPGAEEIPYDDIDQDCDEKDLADLDGDSYDAIIAGGEDCDDNDSTVYPGAEEVPNDEVDQDCDGIDLAIWENIVSGSSFLSFLSSVIQGKDYGYTAIGWTAERTDRPLIWLLKTDAYGNEEWSRYFEEYTANIGTSIVPSSDEGYILLGTTGFEPPDYGPDMEESTRDILMIKTDSDGNEEWRKIYGSDDSIEEGNDIFRTNDNHFIIVGSSGTELLLMKTDSEGNEIWSRTYDDEEAVWGFEGNSIIETEDGGYITTGYLFFHDDIYLPRYKLFVLKTDSDGNEEWRSKPFEESSSGSDIIEVDNSGYAIVGRLMIDDDSQFILLKVDQQGEEEWLQVFTPPPDDTTFRLGAGGSLKRTTDGGYILAGLREDQIISRGIVYDIWLIKTDEEGNREWDVFIDMSIWDMSSEVINTNDGGYMIVGGAGNNTTCEYGLLIKTDSNGISY